MDRLSIDSTTSKIVCNLRSHGIKLHHDNGRPHFHQDVLDYLRSEGITVIQYPPNSPDLSSCDFWLFDLIRRNVADQPKSETLNHAIAEFMWSLD